MRRPAILITGAGGEIGHALIPRLAGGGRPVVTIDVRPLAPALGRLVQREWLGSVTDRDLLERILAEFEIDCVFHLAALLSTRSEFTPLAAHDVNVDGTLRLLEFAQRQGESHGRSVMFLHPSSVAVYGLPDLDAKRRAGAVREDECTVPRTMYGCNKLSCEHLGRYFSQHYKQLAAGVTAYVDFRCLRFPGLLSATTVPAGGTSDYASEMLHASARGEPYACFVRPDTRMPFMVMPDAIDALLRVAAAPRDRLTRPVYNIAAFSPDAGQIADAVSAAFPGAAITWRPDPKRQAIVDSWPEMVDDSAARADWGFAPAHDFAGAFDRYLVPMVRAFYREARA